MSESSRYSDRPDVAYVGTGIRDESMGQGAREKFASVCEKHYAAIGKEVDDLRASIHEIRHKLLGPEKTVSRTPNVPAPEPSGDIGVLDKIELSNRKILNHISDAGRDMRDLLNRI